MEKDETFVLMSMKDAKSKELANAISNETSRKIISHLTEKGEATETQLARELDVPLTTIHYNINQLKKTKLIEAKEFFWSKKGKEMPVYKLAKKFIIIAPSHSESTLSKLKNLLPATIIGVIGSGIIYLVQKTKGAMTLVSEVGTDLAEKGVGGIEQEAIVGATKGENGAAQQITDGMNQVIAAQPNYALWFLFGSLFIILMIFLFSLRKK